MNNKAKVLLIGGAAAATALWFLFRKGASAAGLSGTVPPMVITPPPMVITPANTDLQTILLDKMSRVQVPQNIGGGQANRLYLVDGVKGRVYQLAVKVVGLSYVPFSARIDVTITDDAGSTGAQKPVLLAIIGPTAYLTGVQTETVTSTRQFNYELLVPLASNASHVAINIKLTSGQTELDQNNISMSF